MTSIDETRERLIAHLLEHSVRRGEFTLKSGRTSSYFIDAKQTICDPEGVVLVADLMLAMMPADVDSIGGLTVGADPVAYGVAAIAATRGRGLRSFTVRKEAKGHGVMGRIAGPLRPGDRVVVPEDAVTRGTSMLEAAEVIREAGAHPIALMPVVDRGRTAADLAREAGIEYLPLVTAADLGLDPDE